MYASLSWKNTDWYKRVTWGDPDIHGLRRGSDRDEYGQPFYKNVVEDIHIMYALEAQKSPSEITLDPMEREADTQHLKINKGFYVYVGNGFLYWETDNEAK